MDNYIDSWESTPNYTNWRLDCLRCELEIKSWWFPRFISTEKRRVVLDMFRHLICEGSQQLEHGKVCDRRFINGLVKHYEELYRSMV